MKIAVANWSSRRAGGVESYLAEVVPQLMSRGHQIALVSEIDEPSARESIVPPGVALDLCVRRHGREALLTSLREWNPDVVFTHQLHDLELERALGSVAPAVAFGHAYYGTCISGSKTHRLPSVHPCSRQLGPGCLVHFYPNRCGGLNPLTTAKLYREQTARRELMRSKFAVVTFSEHMAQEYGRHGMRATRVWRSLPDDPAVSVPGPSAERRAPSSDEPWQLMFLGRFDYLKGVDVLLDAVAILATRRQHRIVVSLVGDGGERERIASRALSIEAAHPHVSLELPGWLSGAELEREWARAHALIVPSVWPEPFGLVGIEAGRRGLPVVAFGVGAIPEWLDDGVNGVMVELRGRSAENLSRGVERIFSDENAWRTMSAAGRRLSGRFSMANHLAPLEEVLEHAARSRPGVLR